MRRALAAVSLTIVASVGAPACSSKPADAEKTKKGGQRSLVFAADVIPVEAKKVDYVVTAPGLIDAFERVQVTARVAGAVDRVAFREGQEIKKGQVLVVIDSERFQLSVNSAKAARANALAAQQDAEAMVTRREGASDAHPGLIPGEELVSYRTKSLTAKADTEVANEALKGAELNLRDSSVRAPMDGIVQTRTIETGQYVQAGYIMATLLRKDPMLLRFQVQPDRMKNRLGNGGEAFFRIRRSAACTPRPTWLGRRRCQVGTALSVRVDAPSTRSNKHTSRSAARMHARARECPMSGSRQRRRAGGGEASHSNINSRIQPSAVAAHFLNWSCVWQCRHFLQTQFVFAP